jgi:predicted AlkP superfamily phosphohydrolase/phosphomutase
VRRVIAVGIDAGSIDLIEQLVAEGSLPHLAQLRERSVRVPLESEPAHRHGVVWPQFVAGADAELAGEWLRFTIDPSTYEAFQTGARHTIAGHAPFWEPVTPRVVTLDVPGTTVMGPGVHVTAWGASAPLHPRASQPPGLLRELDRRFGVHPGFGQEYDCGWHDPARLDRLTNALVIGARRRGDIAVELMDRDDWDLMLTVMSESHSASEIMWHAVDGEHPLAQFDAHARQRLDRVYGAIDAAIGNIADHAPRDAAIVVFSLDGMRTNDGDLPSMVLLPELMHRLHFGRAMVRDSDVEAWRRVGCPAVVPPRGRPWRHDLDARLIVPPHRPWTHVVPGYQGLRRTTFGRRVLERVKGETLGALGLPIPAESPDGPEALDAQRESVDAVQFIDNYRPYRSAMRAFALPTFADSYVRINLVGRDAHGIVPIDEFEAELQAVEDMIRACRDVRTGAPIADRIERVAPDDPFGARSDRYGDLHVEWSGPTDAIEHPEVGVIGPFPFNRTGAHHAVGFAWLSGKGLEPATLGPRRVQDLPPTLVRLLDDHAPLPPAGVPIPLASAHAPY